MKKCLSLLVAAFAISIAATLSTAELTTPNGAYDGTYSPPASPPGEGLSAWRKTGLNADIYVYPTAGVPQGEASHWDNSTSGRIAMYRLHSDNSNDWKGNPALIEYEFYARLKMTSYCTDEGGSNPSAFYVLGFRDEGGSGKTVMLGWYNDRLAWADNGTLRSSAVTITSTDYRDDSYHEYRVIKWKDAAGTMKVSIRVDGTDLATRDYSAFSNDVDAAQGFFAGSSTAGIARIMIDDINYYAWHPVSGTYDGSYNIHQGPAPDEQSIWTRTATGSTGFYTYYTTPSTGTTDYAVLWDYVTDGRISINRLHSDQSVCWGSNPASVEYFYSAKLRMRTDCSESTGAEVYPYLITGFRDEGGSGKTIMLGWFNDGLAWVDNSTGKSTRVLIPNTTDYRDAQWHSYYVEKYRDTSGTMVVSIIIDGVQKTIRSYSYFPDDASNSQGFFLGSSTPALAGVSIDQLDYDIRPTYVWANIEQGNSIHPEILGIQPRMGYFGASWLEGDFYTPYVNSMRGVSIGLDADTYDWRTRLGAADLNVTTLSFLQECRDISAMPVFTVNIRGRYDSTCQLNDDDLNSTLKWDVANYLKPMATNWVTYVNSILPNYDNNDTLPSNYQTIVNSISWGTKPKLRSDGEAAVPTVGWWEIGNEPGVPVPPSNPELIHFMAGSSTQYPSPNTPEDTSAIYNFNYAYRYREMAAAVRSTDTSAKVGICTTGLAGSPEQVLLQYHYLYPQTYPVDFISIHPYGSLHGSWNDVASLENAMNAFEDFLRDELQNNKDVLSAYNLDPADYEYMATEWNPFSFLPSFAETYHTSISQAIASVENIMTFARDDMRAAHLFGMVKNQDDIWPIYYAFEALHSYLGNTLITSVINTTSKTRIYVTKNSSTGVVAVWGLNFNDKKDYRTRLCLTGHISTPCSVAIEELGNNGKGLYALHNTDYPEAEMTLNTVYSLSSTSATCFNMYVPAASIRVMVLTPLN